jgi:hypothetical protein
VAVAQFEILAAFMLLLLGWVFAPFYLRSGVFTMPEFLERRYSPAARWYLAAISILGYVLTKISVTIFAGGLVFVTLMGIDFWTGALVVVVATGLYTILGGLRAVLITDAMQMVVLLGGAIAVTVIGLNAVGGWNELVTAAGPEFMTLWKPATDPNFPWTGILLGAPILGIWYWCTDQFIVQRVLAARNLTEARRGTVFAGFLKLLPLFIFVIPGVIAYVLVQQGRLGARHAGPGAPGAGGHAPPRGPARRGGGRAAGRADELAVVRLQLDVHAHHLGRLQEDPARRVRAAAGLGGPDLHRRAGGLRAPLDPAHGADLGDALPVPPERAGLHRAAHRGRVPAGALLGPPQRPGRHERAARGLRAGHEPAGGRS